MSRLFSSLCLVLTVSIGITTTSGRGADARPDPQQNHADWEGATQDDLSLSNEAKRLFAIAEDATLALKTRADAVDEIGKLRERAAVPRLLRLLPGHYDVLTLRCLLALEEIQDPRAIPVLEQMQKEAQDLSGKVNGALIRALAACKANRQRGEKGGKDK